MKFKNQSVQVCMAVCSLNKSQKLKRNLDTSFSYIHGAKLITLVKFQYTNSEYEKKIGGNGDFTKGGVYIGYFKLSQTIIETNYLPLITIRYFFKKDQKQQELQYIQQQQYALINLYIVNDTTVELVFYNDAINKITKITQNVPNLQNKWIALGFGVIHPFIKLIYQEKSGSPKLSATSQEDSKLPENTYLSTWNICITCNIEGGNFDHFKGSVSTVKFIQAVDLSILNQFSYFNEMDISQQPILSTSFNLDTYVRESEYDFGQGITCNPGFYFLEGVCVKDCIEIQEFDPHSDYESGRFQIEGIKKRCILCPVNCNTCNATACTACRIGYDLVQGKCNRKKDAPCPTCLQFYDHMNYYRPEALDYDQYSHKLNPKLLSNRVFLDNNEVEVAPSLTTNKQIILCYIDVENNPVILYSFVGGVHFTKQTRVSRFWNKVPIGYQKKVSFYALFYGSGTPQNLIVLINKQIAQFNNTYETIQLNKISCSGSDKLKQSIYKVEFYINDYQTYFELQIQSTVDQWAIRNIDIEVLKCHPTCGSCLKGGGPQDCTSCGGPELILNNFSCVCKNSKYYPKYNKQFFQAPSYFCNKCQDMVAECETCENLTGKCIKCKNGKIVQDGICILPNLCSDHNEKFSNFCGTRKEIGLSYFESPKIISFGLYWKLYNNDNSNFQCLSKQFAPIIGEGNMHSLQMNLPNYQKYHYKLNIIFEIVALDTNDKNDRIEMYDNDQQIFSQSYANKLVLAKTPEQKCGINAKFYYSQKETIEYSKDNQQIFLKFKSVTNKSLRDGNHSFTNLDILYVRCHPLCKECDGPLDDNCKYCIDNASVQNGKCECKDGYFLIIYQTLDDNILPGKCEKCDSSCKTCNGPSYQDCTSCSDGYILKDTSTCIYKCPIGQYWYEDKSNQANQSGCKPCHGCCSTCETADANSCHTCKDGMYMSNTDNSCYFAQSKSKCDSCSFVQNSYCGGNKTIHNDCMAKGWTQMNSNVCVYCGDFINNNCAGDQDQSVINVCIQRGFQQFNDFKCSSCSSTNKDQKSCGIDQFKNICEANGWLVLNINECINCRKDSPQIDSCTCHNTCKTCSKHFSKTDCTSCIQTHTLFENECLPKCPNGMKSVSQVCKKCEDQEISTCFSCFKTCLTCEPFDSKIPNSCTKCSELTRELDTNGECKCKHNEDQRQNFFECSYNDIAVIDAIISKDSPQLSIDFGKILDTSINLQIEKDDQGFPEKLCKFLFDSKTLSLLGNKASCTISENFIFVKFDKDAKIIEGDLINFNPNTLKFKKPPKDQPVSKYIVKYFNNVVIQEKIVDVPQVIYDYLTEQNSCNDISISFVKFINDGNRGFNKIDWKIANLQQNQSEELGLLNNILKIANDEQKSSILVPKGIIKPDMDVTIQLDYHLKINYKSSIQFPIKLKLEKNIIIDFQTPIQFPFYRFQSGMISIASLVKTCLPTGEVISKEPLKLQISCEEHPTINYSNSNYEKSEYIIGLKQFTFPSQKLTINVKAQLVSNPDVQKQIAYELPVTQTPLLVKIKGSGSSGYFHYQSKVEINSLVKDNDIQNENDPQGIEITWTCLDPTASPDPAKQTQCKDKNNKIIDFTKYNNKLKAIIEPDTFNPYTFIQVYVTGKKPIDRMSQDRITLIYTELDLPPLGVDLKTGSFDQKTINLNEEIQVTLDYSQQVNVDTLSFSGTIIYESKVVGVIKFDYTQLRFQLWNYFPGFKREVTEFQVRFSVFNPRYYMPSSQLLTLNINFPPKNCKFTVAQSSPIGYSVETKFLLQMQNCEDENTPIQYQFFFYMSDSDFEFEKKYPLQVKRCQITDRSKENTVNTILPPGQIVLLAQAIDSKQGIYNSTISLQVLKKDLDENAYVSNVQTLIDSMSDFSVEKQISDLSIISYDILKRKELQKSTKLNNKKIEIIDDLKEKQKNLSTFSSFATNINKAISSLTESGINFSTTQSAQVLNDLFTSLEKNFNDQSQDSELSKEKLKQNLYDSFQVIDSFSNSKSDSSSTFDNKEGQQKIVDLQEKIGKYLFQNLLPNEDPVTFKGKSSSIASAKITSKYICTYFMCESFQDGVLTSPSNDENITNIYNVKFLSSSDNPYKYDESFQNYTNQLKKSDSKLQISTYPVITPDIKDDKNQKLTSFENKVSLKFSGQTNTNKKPMVCVSRNSNSKWTKDNCQNIYNKISNTYTCICQSLSPTTILDDLSDLISNNNLVNTALTEDGFNNISNFTEFYKYVVFWLLCFLTVALMLLFIKGRALDKIDSKNHKPTTFQILNTVEQSSQNIILKKGNKKIIKSRNQILPISSQQDIENKSLKQESSIKQGANYENEIKSRQQLEKSPSNQLNEEKQSPEAIITQQELQDEDKKEKNKNISISPRGGGDSPQQTDEDIKEQQLFMMPRKSKFGITSYNEKSEPSQSRQVLPSSTSILKDEPDKKEQENPYLKQSLFKQIIVFHNFFGVYYVYNSNVSRGQRFLIFYVRAIHSIAISVIFDSRYSIVQRVAIAIINAISIIIVVKLLELLFKCKIGKIIGPMFILGILGSYLYVILSIASGQAPGESNNSLSYFSILFFCDILCFSTISAVLSRWISILICKSKNLSGFLVFFYKAIELQLILNSLE